MSLRKGQGWGVVARPPDGVIRVADDRALHALVNAHRSTGTALPAVAPISGDLVRALGGSGQPRRLDAEMAIVPVDLVRVEVDDDCAWFVSHLVARRSWWRGRIIAAMNGQYLGSWDVAPRAHPGDGRVDLVAVDAGMSARDRWQARRRITHGLHLPHPSIAVHQLRSGEVAFRAGARIWLDGVAWRRASHATLTVEPDALTVCV